MLMKMILRLSFIHICDVSYDTTFPTNQQCATFCTIVQNSRQFAIVYLDRVLDFTDVGWT
jgi:hypothetical protein